MTRTLPKKLIWNGVIYGMAFAAALLISALLQPAQQLNVIVATKSLDQPMAETTPANSVAEAIIP